MTRVCLTALSTTDLDRRVKGFVAQVGPHCVARVSPGMPVFTPNRCAPDIVAVVYLHGEA